MTDPESNDDKEGSNNNGGVDQMDVNNKLVRDADSRSTTTAPNSDGSTEVQQSTPSILSAPLILSPVGMTQDKYDFQVMDTYINAKAWGICQQKICDEYFGNDKGQYYPCAPTFV